MKIKRIKFCGKIGDFHLFFIVITAKICYNIREGSIGNRRLSEKISNRRFFEV